jgi:hypothetical protein
MAKSTRAAMKAKAARMGGKGDPKTKVDASSWTPPEMMNTEAKTGMRPLSRRAFKKGGKVVEKCEGGPAAMRSDRAQRKAGGRSLVTDLINRNVKKANKAREGGDAHVGGYAKGGDVEQDKKLIKKAFRQHDKKMHGGKHEELKLRKGGMAKKQAGGAADKAIPGDAPTRGPSQGTQATGAPYKDVGELIEKKGLAPKERARGGKTYFGGTRPTGGRLAKAKGGGADDDEGYFSGAPARASDAHMIRALKEHGLKHSYKNGVLHAVSEVHDKDKGWTEEETPIGNSTKKLRDVLGYEKGGRVERKAKGGAARFGGTRPTGGRIAKADGGSNYSKEAVDKEIRKDKRIGRGEASRIHALLKGRSESSTNPMKNFGDIKMTSKDEGFFDLGGLGYDKKKKSGGRAERKSGGRTKGKTNIIISINAQKPDQNAMMPKMPTPPPMPVPPVAPPPMGAGAPPMPPPGGPPPGLGGGAPGMPPGMPPKPFKRGGRAYKSYKDMDAGAMSGFGRLEKTAIQKHKR